MKWQQEIEKWQQEATHVLDTFLSDGFIRAHSHYADRLNRDRLFQLVYGQRVRVLESEDDFAYIESLEHPYYDFKNQLWKPYRCYLLTQFLTPISNVYQNSDCFQRIYSPWASLKEEESNGGYRETGEYLPAGSCLSLNDLDRSNDEKVQINQGQYSQKFIDRSTLLSPDLPFESCDFDVIRWYFVESIQKHLNEPYVWGGSSTFLSYIENKKVNSPRLGWDCSGLIYGFWLKLGLIIPRDAKDQAMTLLPCDIHELNRGDLLFFSKTGEICDIDHVAIIINSKEVLEAKMSLGKVCRRSILEVCGEISQEVGSKIALANGNYLHSYSISNWGTMIASSK